MRVKQQKSIKNKLYKNDYKKNSLSIFSTNYDNISM